MSRNLGETVVNIPEESVGVKLIEPKNGTGTGQAPDQMELELLSFLVALRSLQIEQSNGPALEFGADIQRLRGKFGNLDGFILEHKKSSGSLHLTSLVYERPKFIESMTGPLITASKIRHGYDCCVFPMSASAFQEINFGTEGGQMPFLTAKLPTLNICPCCETNDRSVEISSPHVTNQLGKLEIFGHIRDNAVLENKLSNEKFVIQRATEDGDHSGHGPVIKVGNARTGELVAIGRAIRGIETRTYRNGRYVQSDYKWNEFLLVYLDGGMSGVDKALLLMAICVWVVEMKEKESQQKCRGLIFAVLFTLFLMFLCLYPWYIDINYKP